MEINDPQENYISGYVKIYRSVVNHWLWIEKPYTKFEAWIFLLIRANFKDAKINIGFELFEIKRGQFISSQEKLAEQFGWTRNQVRSFIGLLEIDKMIVCETNSKFTKITVCNYDTYQSNLPTTLQPINNDLTTTLQRSDTNKKDKKVKNNKIVFNESEIFDLLKFKNTFPDWSKEKLRYYYEAAERYSNEGNKYIDWAAAIRSWAKKDELQGKIKFDKKEFTSQIPNAIV